MGAPSSNLKAVALKRGYRVAVVMPNPPGSPITIAVYTCGIGLRPRYTEIAHPGGDGYRIPCGLRGQIHELHALEMMAPR